MQALWAPFLNRVAHRYRVATRFYAPSHPSLPNYLAMISGSTHGCSSDHCKGGFAGPMGAIHGEFVVPNGSNGYRTLDVQRGQVTSVSSDSITVKSADGFSKTYDVDQNTVVDSGRDGIGNVKKDDTVDLTAVASGGKASAMSINDETNLGSIRQHWNPNTQSPPTSAAPAT